MLIDLRHTSPLCFIRGVFTDTLERDIMVNLYNVVSSFLRTSSVTVDLILTGYDKIGPSFVDLNIVTSQCIQVAGHNSVRISMLQHCEAFIVFGSLLVLR